MKKSISKAIVVFLSLAFVAYVGLSLAFGVWNPARWTDTKQTQVGEGDTGNGQNKPSKPSTPTTPDEELNDNDNTLIESYSITSLISGEGTNSIKYSLKCPKRAKFGELVTFTINIEDEGYSLFKIELLCNNILLGTPELIKGDNSYSFIMPYSDVCIKIYAKRLTSYEISFDSLGSGSTAMLDIDCPFLAFAEQEVTFTAKVRLGYSYLEITGVAVEFSSGETYIEDLPSNDGVYTFTMPDTDIVLMFYIMAV